MVESTPIIIVTHTVSVLQITVLTKDRKEFQGGGGGADTKKRPADKGANKFLHERDPGALIK